MAYRTFWVNWIEQRRQYSDQMNMSDPVQTLVFFKYQILPVKIYLLESNPNNRNSFTRLDVTGLSLTATVNDTTDDASPLVETTTWTKDANENCFTGILNFATAAMSSYIGSTDNKSAYFQIKFTDANGPNVCLRETCTLRLPVDKTTTEAPSPQKIYLTFDEAKGLFMPRELGAGECITFASPNGTKYRTIGVTDEGTALDDFSI